MTGLGPRWRKRLSEVMATYLWLWCAPGRVKSDVYRRPRRNQGEVGCDPSGGQSSWSAVGRYGGEEDRHDGAGGARITPGPGWADASQAGGKPAVNPTFRAPDKARSRVSTCTVHQIAHRSLGAWRRDAADELRLAVRVGVQGASLQPTSPLPHVRYPAASRDPRAPRATMAEGSPRRQGER